MVVVLMLLVYVTLGYGCFLNFLWMCLDVSLVDIVNEIWMVLLLVNSCQTPTTTSKIERVVSTSEAFSFNTSWSVGCEIDLLVQYVKVWPESAGRQHDGSSH